MSNADRTEHPAEAAAYVRARLLAVPDVAVVLGSGLGSVAAQLKNASVFDCRGIPHWPGSFTPGHAGMLSIGYLSGHQVAIAVGRHHYYEAGDLGATTFAVRVLAQLGCRTLILTNAAGGIRADLAAGSFMLLRDHINLPALAGLNPLLGLASPAGQPYFQPMTNAYSPRLRELAGSAAAELGIPLSEGVYAMVSGPSYETPAEVRALRTLGADAVGMSTASEVIMARALGIEVLAISCITNRAADETGPLAHEAVLASAATMTGHLDALLSGIIARLGAGAG